MGKNRKEKKNVKGPMAFAAPAAITAGAETDAGIEQVALHLTRIHNEFSHKLKVLQQTVERNQRTTVLFSRALYQFVRPFRVVGFVLYFAIHPYQACKLIRDYFYIWRSKKFDKAFYLRNYPDVMAAAFNPLLHYCRYGWKEMRNPSSNFVTAGYLKKNPDVSATGMNPFYHYLRYGQKEHWRDQSAAAPVTAGNTPQPVLSLQRMHFANLTHELTDEEIDGIGTKIREILYGAS